MKRDVLRAADAVITGTEYERRVVERLAGRTGPISTIDNGFDPVPDAPDARVDIDAPYVAMVGTVSARKGQIEVLAKLGHQFRFVVAGGFHGSTSELERWKRTVDATGSTWLGEIENPGTIRHIMENAYAFLLLSKAEVQSLAVMESLALGTPVVGSAIPSHHELATRWPGWVHPVRDIRQARRAIHSLRQTPPRTARPDPPTWTEVAKRVETVYRSALS